MNFLFDLHSFHQLQVHCYNFSSWLKAMIECWNFLNSKLWGLVRCRKKRISASRDRYLRWAMKISHALVQCNFYTFKSFLSFCSHTSLPLIHIQLERVKKEWWKLQNQNIDLHILPTINVWSIKIRTTHNLSLSL